MVKEKSLRETCSHDHFITVFLHYVDQDGDLADYKFDQRTHLGKQSEVNDYLYWSS